MTVSPHSLAAQQLLLLRLTLAVFLGYLTVGLPLTVIPLYVHDTLQLSNFWVGIAIGIQFIATVLTRAYAGRSADNHAKRTTRQGLLACAGSGIFYLLAYYLPVSPLLKLLCLLLGRLLLGFGESQLLTGNLAWGLGVLGAAKSGKVMSYNGMAIYGALAVGAPLGLVIYQWAGFLLIALTIICLPLLALLINRRIGSPTAIAGQRAPLSTIIGTIWPAGLALALQGVGFATIGAFIVLYFRSQQWPAAGLSLSAFGAAFVLMRVVAGHLPDKFAGKVALYSLLAESIGLALLFYADHVALALIAAAITGAGCSLIFPALGVEIIRRVPAQSRATALGGYAAFQDIAYAVASPVAGIIASYYDYATIFACAALCALIALIPARLMHYRTIP